jgi:hypothetical protein
MIKKEVDKLPDDILPQVLDFIIFLETRSESRLLAKASQELSSVSFEKIWDNEEDAVYDSL